MDNIERERDACGVEDNALRSKVEAERRGKKQDVHAVGGAVVDRVFV